GVLASLVEVTIRNRQRQPFGPVARRPCEPILPCSSGASSPLYAMGGGCWGGALISRIMATSSSDLRRRSSSVNKSQSDLMSSFWRAPQVWGWRRLLWSWGAATRTLLRGTSSLL